MIWCWGKDVTREESWRGLRGSEEVIERRREAEDMIVETDREMMQNKERASRRISVSGLSIDSQTLFAGQVGRNLATCANMRSKYLGWALVACPSLEGIGLRNITSNPLVGHSFHRALLR